MAALGSRFNLNCRLIYTLAIRAVAPGIERSITELKKRHPFLIVSTGRTATLWLADLLDEASGTCVVHEPVPDEQYYHAQALLRSDTIVPYLRTFRLREMAFRVLAYDPIVYGEVNGALRRHIVALKELVPEFYIIHLVRDGRDVVTSVMNRYAQMERPEKCYGNLVPPHVDRGSGERIDSFERVCRVWALENAYMRLHSDSLAAFEDILSSYELFREQILRPLGLEMKISEGIWQSSVDRPKNMTKERVFGSWDSWAEEQKQEFAQICEHEMEIYGYRLE